MSEGLVAQLTQRAPVPLQADIRCKSGQLATLVGPSGSGKSTILRCIAGLHRTHGGEVRCNGTTWFGPGVDLPPQQRRVGLVFQSYALFPHLTALQNVALAAQHLPGRGRETRARELLDLVHLSGLELRRPHQLSGGQQQRVALARALARDPEVLLLDEPFAAVDRVTRRKLQRELAMLRERVRIPIVLVTHDLDEARMLGDTMTILHHGRTLQSGPPGDLMARPQSAEVARLLDLGNLFEGVVQARASDGLGAIIEWDGHRLNVARAGDVQTGEKVSWVIAPEYLLLHRRDRPSQGERENPVSGVVRHCVEMGETTSVSIQVGRGCVEDAGGVMLAMNIATHHARRNQVAVGSDVSLSLLAEGIHVMPWSSTGRDSEKTV